MWWNAENAGDTVTGTIAGWSDYPSKENEGERIPILILNTADGELDVSLSRSVLRSEIERACVAGCGEIGQELTLTYNGKPQGKRYHHYTVTGPGVPENSYSRSSSNPFTTAAAPTAAPVQSAPAPVEDDDIPF